MLASEPLATTVARTFFFSLRLSKGGAMYPIIVVEKKSYGFFHFIFDCFMVLITWGLWLIWIFVREMRKSRSPYLQI